MPEIGSYVATADAKDPKYSPFEEDRFIPESDETSVSVRYISILGGVGSVVLGKKFSLTPQKYSSSSSLRIGMSAEEAAIHLASDRVARSGMMLKLEDRLFSVVEMMGPSVFRTGVDEDCPSLFGAYQDMSMGNRTLPRSPILVEPILQLYKYLVNMQLGYGIISSLDLSYFVRREGDNLFISEAITGRNRLLGAVAYFMDLAARDNREFRFGRNGILTCFEVLATISGAKS